MEPDLSGSITKMEQGRLVMELTPVNDGQEVDVHFCSACGEHHPAAPLLALPCPALPYTHYFECPNLDGAPVLCMASDTGAGLVASDDDLLTAVVRAMASGKWMVACWRVEHQGSGGRIYLDRISRGFPIEDYERSLNLLRENMARAGLLTSTPKPATTIRMPLRSFQVAKPPDAAAEPTSEAPKGA